MAGGSSIERHENTIRIGGDFGLPNLPYLVATMHRATHDAGYQDMQIEFAECTHIEPPAIIGAIAQIRSYVANGVEIELGLPVDTPLKRLFLNANWAHFIDPFRFPESRYKSGKQLPAYHYTDGERQFAIVNEILDKLLSAATGFERAHFRAIEWALNEITDNVINHAHSPVGGFVQLTSFPKKRSVQIAICDAGAGIPRTLRDSHVDIRSDQEALDMAIREGITRDKSVGQGNGLYGSWRISKLSKGKFFIYSRNAKLTSNESAGLHVAQEKVPFNGTLIFMEVPYTEKNSLENALNFSGRLIEPVDLIEIKYESADNGILRFGLLEEANSGMGTRASGAPVRNKLLNLFKTTEASKILIDFSGVHLVSSSFADEVFGKLFAELGPILFSSRFEFANIDPLVRQIVDKSIHQRLAATMR